MKRKSLYLQVFILALFVKIFAGAPETQLSATFQTSTKQETSTDKKQSDDIPAKMIILPNSLPIYMVYIPGGSFVMGSDENAKKARKNEFPAHKVELDSFWIGRYEITQAVWKSVMFDNPSQIKGDLLPVNNISWNDAEKFISRLNLLDIGEFSLPTEAQWERACRASVNYSYFFGDDESELKKYAWYKSDKGKTLHPVGMLKQNSFGLYDVHGNVLEWCADWYDENYYSNSPEKNPAGASAGRFRVARGGGGWYDFDEGCRSAFRFAFSPGMRDAFLGLRIVMKEKAEKAQ